MKSTHLLFVLLVAGPCAASAEDQSPARVVVSNGHFLGELKEKSAVELVDIPLREVFAYLSERHAIPFIMDDQALEAARIPCDTPVNCQLSGVSLHTILETFLEPLGLVYVVEDEIVLITTYDRSARRRSTRVYDVRHLLSADVTIESLAEAVEHVAGDRGRITPVGRVLVVTQGGHEHVQTERLLAAMASRLAETKE